MGLMITAELGRLESQDLIRRLNDPDWSYLFKHALVQDTAYASLLKTERKRLHRLIGQTLERVFPEAIQENAALLTQHYAEAGDEVKTLEYGTRAGDTAARVFAKAEAIQHYRAALQAALAISAPAVKVNELTSKLGRMYELQNDFQSALEVYASLDKVAKSRGDKAIELAGLMLEATLRATPTPLFDSQVGQALLDRALLLARELEDASAEAKILWNLLLLKGFTGEYDAAVAFGEQSLRIARKRKLRSQTAYTLNDLGAYGYLSRGQTRKARQVLKEAQGLWRELDNLPMLADNLNISGILEYSCGNFSKARQFSTQALRVSEQIESVWADSNARSFLGNVAMEFGEYADALAELRQAFVLAQGAGLGITWLAGTSLALLYALLGDRAAARTTIRFAEGEIEIKFYRGPAKATLAYLTLLQGEMRRAQEILEDAQPRSPNGMGFTDLGNILAEGEIGLALGRPEHVARFMEELVATQKRAGLNGIVADALLYHGRALVILDQPDAARTEFEEARTIAKRLGMRRTLWQICANWARLERAQGNSRRANSLQKEAVTIVDWIAAHTPSEFRKGFRELAAAQLAPAFEPNAKLRG
jgi:tetratricopeptide (TPR) repeat protein